MIKLPPYDSLVYLDCISATIIEETIALNKLRHNSLDWEAKMIVMEEREFRARLLERSVAELIAQYNAQ